MRETGLMDSFELLHFHLGSQISNIRNVKNALREVGRFYVEVHALGAPLKYLDVGGGLGVDYDGSQTNFSSSMNYTTEEYANDVVFSVMDACDLAKVPHPILVSESGRAVVAHHAVLVTEVLGNSDFDAESVPERLTDDAPQVVKNLCATYRDVTRKNLLETYHDASEYKEESLSLFSLGHLTLSQRVVAENIFWALCHKIMRLARESGEVPEDLEVLERLLSDTYFCNFSLFQSLPDSWAIDQLFPVMPIHRLLGAADPPRRAGRHHLRLRRQNRELHRQARSEGRHPAAPAQRRRVLPGHLHGRRVPGNFGRLAQLVRRHAHGAGVVGSRRRVPD